MKGFKSNTKYILMLALPIIIENILQALLGTTDTYFAGQLNDTAIASISVSNMIMNIFISFFTAVCVGTSAVVSRNFGKADYKAVNSTIIQSIIVGLGLGILVGTICYVFRVQILGLSGADQEVITYAMPYYLIVAVASVVLCLQLTLSSCLRAVKDTKTPMYITALSNVLNIILNALFIKMGLGVFGLGLATTISRGVGMLLLFIKLQHHDEQIYFHKSDFHICAATIKSILTIGIPAGVEKLIMRIGQLLYNGMIISVGMSAYVAHNIAGTIESYSYIPAMGFGLAVSTVVGISLGEDNPKKAVTMTYTSYFISMLTMTFIGAIFYVFAPQLASIFTDTKEVQKLIVDVLRVIAFSQPFSALVQIITNALQGAGDTKFPMYSTILGIWGIRLGMGYLFALPLQMGLLGVWYAYALDLVIRGIILYFRFKNQYVLLKYQSANFLNNSE